MHHPSVIISLLAGLPGQRASRELRELERRLHQELAELETSATVDALALETTVAVSGARAQRDAGELAHGR